MEDVGRRFTDSFFRIVKNPRITPPTVSPKNRESIKIIKMIFNNNNMKLSCSNLYGTSNTELSFHFQGECILYNICMYKLDLVCVDFSKRKLKINVFAKNNSNLRGPDGLTKPNAYDLHLLNDTGHVFIYSNESLLERPR